MKIINNILRKLVLMLLLYPMSILANDSDHQTDIQQQSATAIFAGGCFWCMQPPYDQLKGVLKTEVGYTGGKVKNPTYQQVSSGNTGHTEAIKITYDPTVINYQQLLTVYWRNIDPTQANGQFCDIGQQYRAEIFYLDEQQKQLAEKSKQQLVQSNLVIRPITVKITRASTFYPAEAGHQSYYKKHPYQYKYYRYRCGRDKRLRELWG